MGKKQGQYHWRCGLLNNFLTMLEEIEILVSLNII